MHTYDLQIVNYNFTPFFYIMRAFLRLVVLLLGLVPWAISAQAQGTAFSCDGTFYQVRQAGTGTSAYSVMYVVDRSVATYSTTPYTFGGTSTTGSLGVVVNALAYNSQDGYQYAVSYPADNGTVAAGTQIRLYRIGQGGIQDLGATDLPATAFANGTFDKSGNFYLISRGTDTNYNNTMYVLSISGITTAPTSHTEIALRSAADLTKPIFSSTVYPRDIAFNPSDNTLYGVGYVNQAFKLVINAGRTQAAVSTLSSNPTTEVAGSAFFDVAGNFYAYSNGTTNTANSGGFYAVNTTSGAMTLISNIDPVSSSDGASCINPGSSIDVTKEVTNVKVVNAYTFDISYTIRVRNTYTATLTNVQVSDLLKGNVTTSTNVPFPTATAITIVTAPAVINYDGATLVANGAFTGLSATPSGSTVGGGSLLSGTQSLTAGQRALITYTVRVQFGTSAANVPTTAANNTAYATSTATGPNKGYILTSTDVLLTPNALVANDASTNTANFPALGTTQTNGTPDATDSPSPTPLVFSPSISGVVFEDTNYGGGLGRTQVASNGVGRPGARVELYSAGGTFVSATTTAADGSYSFTGLTAGASYTVRVVSSSVTSSRNTGNATGLVGVQTYRTSATGAGGTVSDFNRVGGEYPARIEAANGASGTTLASLTPITGTTAVESIATVALSGTTPVAGVDFGYNFDTVVNTNNTGQGSLSQFITNANALDNTGLDQNQASTGGNDPAAGVETSIFMITDGRAHDGLTAYNATSNPGLASQLSGSTLGVGGTVANITPTTALPTLTGTYAASTSIDATTQTQNVGNTNNTILGIGGTVGTGNTTLDTVNGPEVQLTGGTSVAYGLDVASSATNTTISGLAIYGFGNALDNTAGANIRSAANGLTVTQSVLGTAATAFTQPATPTNADNIRLIGGTSGISISNNLIGFSNSKGISIGGGVTNVSVTDNEIRSNGLGGSNYDGIDIQGSLAIITGNLLTGTSGQGVDSYRSSGSNTINGNTITDNGRGTTTALGETPGVRIYGANNTISQNIISNNYGAGIMLEGSTNGGTNAAVSTTTISQNSIFGNGTVTARNNTAATGQLGIDLEANGDNESAGTSSYVTLNSATATGANGLLNFPVLTSATVVGTNLILKGYAKPNASVELFIAQPNALTTGSTTGNSFGQGKTYLTTLTAGSTGGASYSGTINGFNQGSDTNANAFTFIIPLTTAQQALVTSGVKLTATSTLTNATSEFSGIVNVNTAPVPNTLTNVSIPNNSAATVLNPNLSGTANGTFNGGTNSISYYTLTSLPASGTLTYNGTVLTSANIAATQITPALLNTLTYTPAGATTGNVSFTYTATDANGTTSTTNNGGTVTNGAATYTIPLTASSDVTANLTGGTTLTSGQPTGYYTATFTNLGPNTANSVTQTVTLPTDASLTTTQQNTITSTYSGTTFSTSGGQTVINFPTATTLASGVANSYRFAFTAPTTTGSSTVVATTSTTSSEGANVAPNSTSLTLTTNSFTDVQATITASAATVAPGATATFTAVFTNNSTQSAAGIAATVQLPIGLLPTNVSGQGGTILGNTVTYGSVATLNTITGVLTYSINILNGSVTTSSAIAFTMPASGIVTATAGITTTTPENNTTNNVASASITAGPRFDLTTSLYGPTSVVAGSPVTLNVTTTNNGPQAIAGAVETVQLPAGLNTTGAPNVFISNGGTYDNTSGVVTFPTLGTLPSGQTVTNTITFLSPTAAFAPSATVTPNTTGAGETNTANNTAYLNGATSSTSLTPSTATTATANVYAVLTTTSTIVASGTQVTYNAGAGNAGPTTASNVTAQMQLIPGLGTSTLLVGGSAGSLSGSTITYPNGATYNITNGLLSYAAIPTLPSGSMGITTVVVTVPATVGNNGQLLTTVSVASATSDVVPGDNVKAVAVTVQPIGDLATTIVGPTNGVVPGQSVTYTATFTNNGPDAASVTAETVQLPANLTTTTLTVGGQTGTLTSTTITFASGATYSTVTGIVTLPAIASDAPGAVQAFNLTFTAPAQSYVVSSAVSSATPDSNPANNAASVATTVTLTADVAVAITGPATVVVGNPVTYVVASTNNGPVTATGIVPTLQLPAGLTIAAGGPGGYTYDNTTGLLTFPTISSLQSGVSVENYVTFTMPNATGGQISALASVSSTSNDNVASNNTAALTTSVAPTTTTTADLLTSITPTGTSVAPGSTVVYTVAYRNASGSTATNVVPTASLPTGLSATDLKISGFTGTLANGLITFTSGTANGTTYDVATGLLAFPTIASLPVSGTAISYTVSLPAPASGQLVVYSAVNSSTTENGPGANRANSSIAVTSAFDLTTSITGPVSALVGAQNVYTVTSINNGPSMVSSATQTVTLPSGLTTSTLLVAGQTGSLAGSVISYSNTGASYNTSTGVLTFAAISNLAPGAAVTNTITVTMPSSGTLTAQASITTASAGETNSANNSNSITTVTSTLSLAPVAENIVNNLQTPQGNTAVALPISPLYATDADGTVSLYTITSLPTAAQGVLYYNNNPVTLNQTITASNANLLSFDPANTFVGNAFFTYTATDNNSVVSNPALYTIPVAADIASTYTAYNTTKGGTNKYVTGDILAQITDLNTATYTSGGIIYNATTGVLQSGAANGLPTTGTNATLATTGPTGNTSNTLPAGVSLDPATGRIYVSNASQLVNYGTARTYSVFVISTDINGGINQVLSTFTIGAYPLPVVLTDFTAGAVLNRDALLTWATASEKNNDHFDIERSFDGTSFTQIGQVAGHGTTTAASAYTLTDANVAAKATGTVYYRLRQVDLDGTATYSPVRSVRFTASAAAAPIALSLYPNPAQASTTLDLSQLPTTGTYQVVLLDATGRTVRATTLGGGLPQVLDVHELASGSYLLLVTGQQPDGSALKQTLRLTKE